MEEDACLELPRQASLTFPNTGWDNGNRPRAVWPRAVVE